VSGIESFVKEMVIMSLALNDCEPQNIFRDPLGGVQSKEFLEDRINDKPIFLRR
jgi:hypothetical protein